MNITSFNLYKTTEGKPFVFSLRVTDKDLGWKDLEFKEFEVSKELFSALEKEFLPQVIKRVEVSQSALEKAKKAFQDDQSQVQN